MRDVRGEEPGDVAVTWMVTTGLLRSPEFVKLNTRIGLSLLTGGGRTGIRFTDQWILFLTRSLKFTDEPRYPFIWKVIEC